MNEKIVILGNGFDLRHFLPTKYDHLMVILREIEILNFSLINEIKFDDLFGNLFKEKDEWFYEEICKHYSTDQIIFQKESLISIQERLKNNNWFKYLKTVEDSKIETWIDFETEIERVLTIILKYFNNFNEGIYDNQFNIQRRGSTLNFSSFDSRFKSKIFDNNLQFNILRNFKLLINKNNNVLFNCNEEFTVVIEEQLQYFKEKDFFDSIYYSLEEFTGVFNDYIISIVDLFYLNFKREKRERFISNGNHFLFDKVQHIYSFNYTKTYLEFYWELINNLNFNRKINVEYVHGKSIKDWNSNIEKLKIVLGVSEINKNLKNHKLFQFTKYFQKLQKDTDYLFLKTHIDDKKINRGINPLDIYFWGHSLDISDEQYIKEIFMYLQDYRSNIKIFYHSISGKADQLKNLLNIIDKNTIEDLMKNKRLIFIESTPDNLFAELS